MNRDELVAAAASAIGLHIPTVRPVVLNAMGATVLDAILPQVTTVEELEALPFDAKVVDRDGEVWARYHLAAKGPRPLRWRNSRGNYGRTSHQLIAMGCSPLTVVWTP